VGKVRRIREKREYQFDRLRQPLVGFEALRHWFDTIAEVGPFSPGKEGSRKIGSEANRK
jgi:hypothetical protein